MFEFSFLSILAILIHRKDYPINIGATNTLLGPLRLYIMFKFSFFNFVMSLPISADIEW